MGAEKDMYRGPAVLMYVFFCGDETKDLMLSRNVAFGNSGHVSFNNVHYVYLWLIN